MVDKMFKEYLTIMKVFPSRQRSIIRESQGVFKVYLTNEFNDVWGYLCEKQAKVDVLVILPELPSNAPDFLRLIDKIVMRKRRIVREHSRFKVYLSKKYNNVWTFLYRLNAKVDILVFPQGF